MKKLFDPMEIHKFPVEELFEDAIIVEAFSSRDNSTITEYSEQYNNAIGCGYCFSEWRDSEGGIALMLKPTQELRESFEKLNGTALTSIRITIVGCIECATKKNASCYSRIAGMLCLTQFSHFITSKI